MSRPLAVELAEWVRRIGLGDLPSDIVRTTKQRVLDVIGLAYAGAATDFGRATHQAVSRMSPPGPCRVVGSDLQLGVTSAAFANASCAQALEFDDTHNESIVHMSSPSVASALALAQTRPLSGREAITAIAVGNEIACRVGSAASGEFHKRGLHPTGLFAPFGVTCLAGKLLDLDETGLASAMGIVGSFASGLLECWVDGTQAKFLHAGHAAWGGITAAELARSGVSGPPRVLEGRFGLFASHLQDPDRSPDYARIREGLGIHWESRNASFKPFPAAHVLHPYIEAALGLRRTHQIEPGEIEEVRCPVPEFIVPIVCEPVAEKRAPLTTSHGRVTLQYTLAEALWRGELGRTAYDEASLRDPGILDLAARVRHEVDPSFPGPGRFRGVVEIRLKNGQSFIEVAEHTRGSRENPMSEEELRAKFDDNTAARLSPDARDRIAGATARLETLADVTELADLLT